MRLLAVSLALAAAAGAAAPALADRETAFVDVPRSSVGQEPAAGLAAGPGGRIAAAWSPLGSPAPVQVAELAAGAWQRWQLPAKGQVRGVAAAYDAARAPVVAFADDGGLELAEGGPAAPVHRLVHGAADAAAVAALPGNQLVAAALVRTEGADRLVVALGQGRLWGTADLGAVGTPPYPSASWLQVARFGQGYALAFQDGRHRLVLELHATLDAPAVRRVLPVHRPATARLATGPDGTLWVLFGGLPRHRRRGEYGYATLRGRRLAVHVLQRRLPCDATGFLVGVGFLAARPRLLYGEGCDVGWQLHATDGRITTDPSTGADTLYGLAAISTTAGILTLDVTQRGSGPHLALSTFGS